MEKKREAKEKKESIPKAALKVVREELRRQSGNVEFV